LESHDIPACRVNMLEDILAHPQIAANGTVVEREGSRRGRIRTLGPPVRLSATPSGVERLAPLLGEHTDEVLREFGVSGAELHELARDLGMRGQFHAASCFHSGTAVVAAPLEAALAIEGGLAHTVLCCQGVAWGSERRGNVGQPHAEMRMKAAFEIPFGWYPQVVHFAGMARRHMELYGTTEAQLGAVAVACRRHAALHDNAILATEPLELDGYLASPYLAEPFRSADCCLVNDGAGAFVMTSLERARELRADPVVVLGVGCGVVPDGEYSSLREDYLATGAVHSAPRAFGMAGLSPADVDFVALYDNFTGLVIQQLEDMGFCARGEGGPFVEGGRIELG